MLLFLLILGFLFSFRCEVVGRRGINKFELEFGTCGTRESNKQGRNDKQTIIRTWQVIEKHFGVSTKSKKNTYVFLFVK